MRKPYCLFTILILGVLSCSPSEGLEQQVLGKWMIDKVYEDEQDVTVEHNPKKDRWIKFNRNSSFESGGDPYGYNDGTWDVSHENSTLFLDSSVEGDDSEWKVIFREGKMIWTGIGTPRQESFKIVYSKVE